MRRIIVMSCPHQFLVGDRIVVQKPPDPLTQCKVTRVPTTRSIEIRSLYWWERLWDKIKRLTWKSV